MFRYVIGLMIFVNGFANAHQFLPTYPKFEPSFVQGVVQTKMELFNRRKEIGFYEVGVFDKDWNKIPFATESKIIQINYLERKNIIVYLKKEDLNQALYICTESKIKREDIQATSIASKICSKIK